MAHSLTPQDVKLLDQTRQRLSQLTNSLTSFQNSLLASNPLPPYSSLHSQTLILGQSLTSLAAHLRSHSSSAAVNAASTAPSPLQLSSTAVYPLPQYPGREEEGLLGQLLRKKLEVGVEEWVDRGREEGEHVMTTQRTAEAWRGLWEWAGIEANGVAREYDWGEDLEAEDDEEDDTDGQDNEGKAKQEKKEDSSSAESKGIPLDDVMRYMARGGG